MLQTAVPAEGHSKDQASSCVAVSFFVLVWVCVHCAIRPRVFGVRQVVIQGRCRDRGSESRPPCTTCEVLYRKEGAARDEGDKGQEIVPVASASGGKEQEGYPGWCVRFPLSTLYLTRALPCPPI